MQLKIYILKNICPSIVLYTLKALIHIRNNKQKKIFKEYPYFCALVNFSIFTQ